MVVTIPLKKTCSLSRFGYKLASGQAKRRASLRQAMAAYGSKYTIHKLSVLRTYRKARSTPEMKKAYDVLDEDIKYVQRTRDRMSSANRTKNKATKYPKGKSYC